MEEYMYQVLEEINLQQLLPCPFCGGGAVLCESSLSFKRIWPLGYFNDKDKTHYWVKCEQCESSQYHFDTPEESVKFWNKRK
jgi:Lar family restriction alleviation protein